MENKKNRSNNDGRIKEYSYDWVKTIYENEDYSLKKRFDPYPLQFANCKRLEYNDDIYLFDEVGTGKTISSGLMAMHFAYNRNQTINLNYIDVLVITDYRMVDINKYGRQNSGKFIGDWKNVLKFNKLKLSNNVDYDFNSRVQVINIYNTRISEYKDKKIGLLIIDEAHRFIQNDNKEGNTLMFDALKELKAEKVICMTATPIRYSTEDIKDFIKLANNIIYNYDNNGKDKEEFSKYLNERIDSCLKLFGNSKEDLLCAKFDYKYPITRYFKDTVKALRFGTFIKNRSKRYEPIKWSVGESELKEEVLVKNIEEEFSKNLNNKFLIFVNTLEIQGRIIGVLEKNYIKYDGKENYQKTFWIANSKTKAKDGGYDVTDFEDCSKVIPDILVVTSGLVEAGVSLPGYNYVVNYSISSLPASIEQRFGRIDRINDSKYEDIKIVFLLSSYNRSEMENFNTAFYSFYNQLNRGKVPSKNIIFNCETITDLKEYQIQEIQKIGMIFNNEYLKNNYNLLDEQGFKTNYRELIKPRIKIIIKKKNECASYEEFEKSILDYIDSECNRLENKYNEIINKFSNTSNTDNEADKIMYCNENLELCTIDAISECSELIKGGENYMKYLEEYESEIDIFKKFLEDDNNRQLVDEMESVIEERFRKNSPYFELYAKDENGMLPFLNECVDRIKEKNKRSGVKINPNNYNFIKWQYNIIPFYKMCDIFNNVIVNNYIEKYSALGKDDVRDEELEILKKEVLYNDTILDDLWDEFVETIKNERVDLSDSFKREYFTSKKVEKLNDLFYVFAEYSDEKKTIVLETSPWLKILFNIINNRFKVLIENDDTNKEIKNVRNNYFKYLFVNNSDNPDSYCGFNGKDEQWSVKLNDVFIDKFKIIEEINNANSGIYFNSKIDFRILEAIYNAGYHTDYDKLYLNIEK